MYFEAWPPLVVTLRDLGAFVSPAPTQHLLGQSRVAARVTHPHSPRSDRNQAKPHFPRTVSQICRSRAVPKKDKSIPVTGNIDADKAHQAIRPKLVLALFLVLLSPDTREIKESPTSLIESESCGFWLRPAAARRPWCLCVPCSNPAFTGAK